MPKKENHRKGSYRRRLNLLGAGFGLLLLFMLIPRDGSAGFAASAENAFQVSLSADRGQAGSSLQITVDYDGSLGELSAFLIEARFEPAWTLTSHSGEQKGYLYDSGSVASRRWIYVRQEDGQGIGPGRVLTLELRLAKDALPGNQELRMSVSQIVSEQGLLEEEMEACLNYQVEKPPSSTAELLSLVPSHGVLTPAFSPDITEYWVTVPFEVVSLAFQAQAAEGGRWTVNRKNLGAGGSSTLFYITAIAADGKARQAYTVTVYRDTKAEPVPTPKPTRTPKPTATPKPTRTPKPTATPKPTRTPKPTATPKPTGTPKPTATPKPTRTPKPTATPKPTKTPKPTATPKPTKTPKPTATPKPTKTPKPTATPKAAPIPDPLLGLDINGSPGPDSSAGPRVRVLTPVQLEGNGGSGWEVAVGCLSGAGIVVLVERALDWLSNAGKTLGKHRPPDDKDS